MTLFEKIDARQIPAKIAYEDELAIPVTDALTRPAERLVDMVVRAFPALDPKLTASVPG